MLDFSLPPIDVPSYDATLVRRKSKHYLAFITEQKCVACMSVSARQRDRTTAHHIRPAGVALKCPDFYTLPIEYGRHLRVDDRISIDHGHRQFLKAYNLPPYEHMVLFYLGLYIADKWYDSPVCGWADEFGNVPLIYPDPEDRHSAIHYFNLLREELS